MSYLEVMSEFQRQFGEAFLRRMGTLIFEKAAFPPGIDNVEKGMALIEAAYNMNHADGQGKIGGYRWTLDGRGGVMLCDNPYPCSFDIGIVTSIAQRFQPSAVVTHLQPEVCRHRGGDACSYKVEW